MRAVFLLAIVVAACTATRRPADATRPTRPFQMRSYDGKGFED